LNDLIISLLFLNVNSLIEKTLKEFWLFNAREHLVN